MKITNYETPKSSFLSIQKDLELIANKIMKNIRLQKLLYYTTPDALSRDKVPEQEVYNLFKNNIKIIPKLYVDGSVLSYISINFDNFIPNATNPEFRDNIVSFDIICHYDQWDLKDFQLRPYMIAAELDSMLDGKHLTGIGELSFLGANQLLLTEEFGGVSLMYTAIHGEEDRRPLPNPQDNQAFIDEFNAIWNSAEET